MSFGGRALPLFGSAIIDQVVLSATNFLVGLLLIRFTTDRDYALYVLVQSGLLLLTSAQAAWLTGPVAIVTPRLPWAQRWPVIGSIRYAQNRWLRIGALALLPLPLLGYLVGAVAAMPAAVSAIAVLAAWAALNREFLRGVLLMYSRPQTLLRADIAYAATLLAGVGIATLVHRWVIVLATWSLVMAAYVGAGTVHRSLQTNGAWQDVSEVSVWSDVRKLGVWSLAGAAVYWCLGQSYSYTLAVRLDLKAVADVNATRLVLMPAFVLTIGVVSLLTPSAATWYVEMGARRLVRRLLLFLLAVGVLEGVYLIAAWLARDWLIRDVLHKTIENGDQLLLLWGGVAVISLFRDVLQCALVAMGRFKTLAWQVGFSTVVGVFLMWYGVAWWGASAVLIGQIAGELLNLSGIVFSILRHLRRLDSTGAVPSG